MWYRLDRIRKLVSILAEDPPRQCCRVPRRPVQRLGPGRSRLGPRPFCALTLTGTTAGVP